MLMYFSDPFIRKMIGPQVKIAQYRRQLGRVRLENVMAANLLYQLDHGQTASQEKLLQQGYLKPKWLTSWEGDQITLDQQGIAHSSLYGTLAEMTPMSTLPVVERLTQEEIDAYSNYVEQYNSNWRTYTYFDPIGVRITLDSPIKIETLILPLVENTTYNQVREIVGSEPVTLTIPRFEPRPVAMLSFKLVHSEKLISKWFNFFNSTRFNPYFFTFGKLLYRHIKVHFAFYDSDPLITLGSSELLSAFSVPLLSEGMRSLFSWPLLGAFLTQPMSIFIELDDAVDARGVEEFIKNWLPDTENHLFTGTLDYRPQDENWIYTINLHNIVRLHAYLRVQDNYLVISNRSIQLTPVQNPATSVSANAWLEFNFDAIHQLASSLKLHQLQQLQQSVARDMIQLVPFFLLGANSLTEAQLWHRQFYGSTPKPPVGDEWTWNPLTRRLESAQFDTVKVSKLPSAEAIGGNDLFGKLNNLKVRFSFEEAGARVVMQITPQ
jgi:hypothetical protein